MKYVLTFTLVLVGCTDTQENRTSSATRTANARAWAQDVLGTSNVQMHCTHRYDDSQCDIRDPSTGQIHAVQCWGSICRLMPRR